MLTCPKCTSRVLINPKTGIAFCTSCAAVQSQPQQIPYAPYALSMPYNVIPVAQSINCATVAEPQTREQWERSEWDEVQQSFDKLSERYRLMFYFLMNRHGLRMDGIEKKIDTLLAEKWKERKEAPK